MIKYSINNLINIHTNKIILMIIFNFIFKKMINGNMDKYYKSNKNNNYYKYKI